MKTPIGFAFAIALAAAPLHAQSVPSPAPAEKGMNEQFKTADEFWAHAEKLQKMRGARFNTMEEFLTCINQRRAFFSEFISRFPNDSRRFEAKLGIAELDTTLASIKGTKENSKAIENVCNEILAAKDAPNAIRGNARFILLETALHNGVDDKLQNGIDAFCKDYRRTRGGRHFI